MPYPPKYRHALLQRTMKWDTDRYRRYMGGEHTDEIDENGEFTRYYDGIDVLEIPQIGAPIASEFKYVDLTTILGPNNATIK